MKYLICINNKEHLTLRAEYTVIKYSECKQHVKVLNDDGRFDWYSINNFTWR